MVLAVGMVAQGSFSALLLGMASIAEEIRDELGLSLAAVGAILAAPAIGSIVSVLGWGALADRVGERAVIAGGLAVAAGALAATASADTAVALGAGLAVAGVFGVSANAASGRAVVAWFPRSERGLALGLRHMSTPLGGALGAALLPVVADAGGLEAALLALAGTLATGSLAAFLGMRRPPPDILEAPPPGAAARPPAALRDPAIWTVSLGTAAVVLAQISLLSFIALYLHEERGWSVTNAALALAGVQLVGAVARVLAGVWSDRAGSRLRPLRLLALWSAIALATASALLGGPDALAAAALAVAAILSMAGNGVSFAAVAEMTGPDRVGTALGLQNTVLGVAVVVASPLFGALVGLVSWTAAFAITSLFPLIGWWLLRGLEARRAVGVRQTAM
ncbi:MAG TPA: MFS transporter [Miltoncostaea sp.]|nr:MFS transporter [Miltoncostaea sp.]